MSNPRTERGNALRHLVLDREEWLMDRVLHYAKQRDYTKYTSTLKEAWRLSIQGLSNSLIRSLDKYSDIPELNPDEDVSSDPCTEFGRIEAQKHRARGVTLEMFLGLMKYFRQSYDDLVQEAGFSDDDTSWCHQYLGRFFDRVDIAFSAEWARTSDDHRLNELQASNRHLANEKNKYLTVFESLLPPVFLIGLDGRVENLNYAAAQMFDGAATPGGLYYSEETHTKELPWLQDELKAFAQDVVGERILEKTLSIHGKPRHFEIKLCRVLDYSDKFAGMIVVLNDVTKRKEAEIQLERANVALQRKNAEMEQFVYTVSHDLKAPLVTINGFASHFRNDLKGGRYERLGMYMDRIQAASTQMRVLIDQLLELSRIGRVVSSPEPVSITPLVRDIADRYRGQQALMDVKVDIAEDMPTLRVDRFRITQVFDNLIGNAFKHGLESKDPQVSVGFCRVGDDARFYVRDNGKGIDPAHHERIFQLFHRLDPTSEGTGVGLAIVKRVAEVHGGRAWVDSKPGCGATFWLAFPASLITNETYAAGDDSILATTETV